MLFNLNAVTDKPEFQLFEAHFPTCFEPAHPLPVHHGIRNIYNKAHKVIAIDNAFMPLMPLDLLSLITDRTKEIHDFEDIFGEPITRYRASIIKL